MTTLLRDFMGDKIAKNSITFTLCPYGDGYGEHIFFEGTHREMLKQFGALFDVASVTSWDGDGDCVDIMLDLSICEVAEIIAEKSSEDASGLNYFKLWFYPSDEGVDYNGEPMTKEKYGEARLMGFDNGADDYEKERALFEMLTACGWCDGFMYLDSEDATAEEIKAYKYAMQYGFILSHNDPQYCDVIADLAGVYSANLKLWTVDELHNEMIERILY